MVNIKSLISSDPRINQLRESELFRIEDSNNLYLRVQGANRRLLCSTADLKYGIGTSSPYSKLGINDDSGNCLSLTRDGLLQSTFTIDATGVLLLTTANGFSLNTPLKHSSGGTGYSSYTDGDILVAKNGTLVKIAAPSQRGFQLMSNGPDLQWSSHVLSDYMNMSNPILVSAGVYTVTVYCRNYTDTDFIALSNVTISSSLSNVLFGSAVINSEMTILPVAGFLVGDTITVGSETREIISSAPSSVTVGSSFNTFNKWTLSGTASMSTTQFKFGSKSLNAINTSSFATCVLGKSFTVPQTNWTVEFFFRLNAVNSVQSLTASSTAFSLAISFAISPANVTVSLGQGVSFNILNASRLATTLVANTWYHFAISYDGSNYRSFIDGVLRNTTASVLQIPANAFASMKVAGGSSTFNGFMDEFRVSKIARYLSAFSPPSAMFVNDSNTVILNHFESTTITASDDNYSGTASYSRNLEYDSSNNQVMYAYAVGNSAYWSFRSSENNLVDVPGNSVNIRRLPLYRIILSGVVQSITVVDEWHYLNTYILIASALNNTVATNINLGTWLPTVKMVKVLITHTHVGNTSCSVVINGNLHLTTATAGSTQLIVTVPSISANLSVTASSTTYSLSLIAFR